MCTISWLIKPTGYRVFFNRDEQKTRPRAQPPQVRQENDIDTIMPIDPQGGGTWMAVNEKGLTFALLNFYQGRLPKGRLISRGKLVKACAGLRSTDEAVAYIESLNLAKYAPFSLLCFEPEANGARVSLLRWDGKKIVQSDEHCPLISSAVRYDEVYSSRIQVYRDLMGELSDISSSSEHHGRHEHDYLRLHQSHAPDRSAESICMHRDDAQTVSFSQVNVNNENIEFYYADGAPCDTPIEKVAELRRVT